MEGLFTVSGTIVPGKRLGSLLGYPTANLAYPHHANLPQNGVYIAAARLDGEEEQLAILNQGTHPTAPEGPPTLEAHLPGYAGGDLYGRRITLSYLLFLRPEIPFPTLEALKTQLSQDRETALAWAEKKAPELLKSTQNEVNP